MLTIKARNILKYDTKELFDKLKGVFILEFDDGKIITNDKETIYSSFTWDFHRKYTNTPLLIKHHVNGEIKNKRVGVATHLNIINNVLWSTYDTYVHTKDKIDLLDDLAKLAYVVSNNIYNELTYMLEKYVTSLDIKDFIDITTNPELMKKMQNMPNNQKGIDSVYEFVKEMFKTDEFKNNPVVHAVNAGIANMGQALQCVSPRGFLTDIDSNIFTNPIRRGFVQGIRNAHDFIIETRSAAKALVFSTSPLQQAEYFSRRQQFICQNVRNLHYCDCGSTQYLTWHVRPARYSNDQNDIEMFEDSEALINRYKSDLDTIQGMYYLDETDNTLKTIKVTDKHLIGKTIKMRSVVAGCQHPDPYGVCEVCFGETAISIPRNSNVGHAACVNMTGVVGQSILSTKHLDGSSTVEGIVLRPEDKKYLSAVNNSSSYFLSENLKNKRVSMVIRACDALGITDLNLVDNVNKLSLSRVTEFRQLGLIVHKPSTKETETVMLDLFVNDRDPSFTYEMLDYIKRKQYIVEGDNIIIDLDEWDYTKPFCVLPLKHYDMTSFQSEIATMLESTMEDMEKRSSIIDPKALLVDFHDLVNKRLSINLSALQIIIYSSMSVDPMNNNYSLPKVGDTFGLGIKQNLLNKRSLGVTMGYQEHKEVLTSPISYLLKNRMDHPFDSIVKPDLLNKQN